MSRINQYFKPKERFADSDVISSSSNAQEPALQSQIPSSISPSISSVETPIPPSIPSVETPIPHSISNEANKKEIYLEYDPAKRTPIHKYHPNEQDEVRRTYLLRGPTRVYMNYPIDDTSGKDRSFVKGWYEEYDWLEYSIERDAVFCLPCYLFYNGSVKTQTPFVKDGWRAWHLKRNLKKHVGYGPNSHHNKCVKNCDDLLNHNQSIVTSLSNYSDKEKSDYLIRLKASLEAVKYLVRGGLAFRARDEGENSVYKGHFREFVEALGRNSAEIGEALKNAKDNLKMTSPKIQKDLANACAVETVKKIVDEIGDGVFCVLVDESGDRSTNEQMAVVLRFVDSKGFVVERLIGIVHVEDTIAITLKGALENLLLGFGLCISQIRGQGYDGANNMKGCLGGLKTLIQKENPQAYYVHCFAHQLQLALVSIVRRHVDANSFFAEVNRIVNLVRSSNKRSALLRKEQVAHFQDLLENDMVETGTGLNQQLALARAGDTRWGSHYRVLLRLKKMFTPIVEVLEELKYDRTAPEAKGLLLLMKQFDFVFMLHLMTDILGVTNELSQALQRSDQDILNAMQLVEVCKKMFQKMRDDGWEEFLEKVFLSCGNLVIKVPDMESRYVKDSRSQRNAPFITHLHYFKYDCFVNIIDVILKELNEHFSPESTELLQCVACLSPSSSFEAFDTESIVKMARLYPNDFDDVEDEELSTQLEVYIHCVRMDSNFSNLKSLSDLCRTLVRTKKHKTFRFVYKLVKLALTLPVSTASVERAFSGMNYVMDDLRTKMSNAWLNDCLVTYVEKEVFTTIDDRDIINRFQAMRMRRMSLKLN